MALKGRQTGSLLGFCSERRGRAKEGVVGWLQGPKGQWGSQERTWAIHHQNVPVLKAWLSEIKKRPPEGIGH